MSAQTVLDPIETRDFANTAAIAPCGDWTDMGKSEHFVQFYEEDSFLLKSLSGFIAAGLRQGETAIVIATPSHRNALDQHLRLDGLDPEASRLLQQFMVLDAAETLSKFMIGDSPDERLFTQVVGGLIARVSKTGKPVRAFGEMVALLWERGNMDGAIRLEELWNNLGKEHSFCLFCAYPMNGCRGEKNGVPFLHVCKAHTRVIPAESYTSGNGTDHRLRTIALLQQKAASLETEVTERKQVQEALAARERELADFLENATEAIHQVSPDGKILWANTAELELLGYAAVEYIGRHITDFHADPEAIQDILERLNRGEKLRDYEARLRHKDGSIRHVAINSSVYWQGDKFVHTKCFTRDITERKRAAEILEQTVVDRTAQLRESIAELEAFSYSISHDMRSPLRAMQGYAKTLVDDYGPKLDPEAVTTLQRIQRASQRLDMLVRDVLAYSKVAKGEIHLQPVALGDLVDDILYQLPDFHGLRQCITVEHPLHSVVGHEACLTQCLTNLIANALKFVPPGSTPEVHIRTEKLGDKIRVWVCDNGIGIHPEHRERIFQIFGRIYPEKRYPGTGIGLAIVKKAVSRMGGETGFDSEPGKGSRFWFTLPFASNGH